MLQRNREDGANSDRRRELGQGRYKRIAEVSLTVVPTKESLCVSPRVLARELGH